MKPQRYGASAAPREDGIFCLYAEYEKVVAECQRLRMQRYELMGVVADVEIGNGFDTVCLQTIKRVIGKLGGAA
jgi:hypothetical protein